MNMRTKGNGVNDLSKFPRQQLLNKISCYLTKHNCKEKIVFQTKIREQILQNSW